MTYRNVQLLGNYLDLLLDMLCVVDDDGRFVYVSASVEQILGYQNAELIGQPMQDYIWPEDLQDTLAAASSVMQGESLVHFENRYRHKDGHAVYLSWSARRSAQDRVRVGVARDVSEIRQTQARQKVLYAISEAAHQAEDLSALYQQAATLVASLMPLQHFQLALPEELGDDWQIRYQQLQLAPGASAAPALSDHRELCRQVALQQHVAWGDEIQQGWLALPLTGAEQLQGVLLLHPGPERCYQAADLALLEYLAAQLGAAIERKAMLARLQRLALYDSLTGLANRALLLDRLLVAVPRAAREQRPLALLYLDLDKFKQMNDQWGHQGGDWVLQQIAGRLRAAVRKTDTVARFGGDEFVILLEQLDNQAQAVRVAEKIHLLLHEPLQFSGQSLMPGASIGLAFYPADAPDARQLMMKADSAMYQAKHQGGSRIVLAGQAGGQTC